MSMAQAFAKRFGANVEGIRGGLSFGAPVLEDVHKNARLDLLPGWLRAYREKGHNYRHGVGVFTIHPGP